MKKDNTLSQIEDHFHVLTLGEKSLGFGKILSTDTSVKILESVYNSDQKIGISASEISESVGIGRTTVIYHLGRMQESGLIEMNPILKTEESWDKFWNLYKSRDADMTRAQFNRVHDARMRGIKLFVPTKKGFLILPSTDVKEAGSMVKEVLSSITSLALERDYKDMKKATSLLGTIGVLLLALSFLFQTPLLSRGLSFAPAPYAVGSSAQMEEATMVDSSSGVMSEPAPVEKAVRAASTDQSYAETTEPMVAEEGEVRSETTVPNQTKSATSTTPITRALFFLGALLIGSFLGFVLYSSIRSRRHL